MIAMAISCHPKFMIADEPTTALDVTVQAQVLGLLKELQEKTNTAYADYPQPGYRMENVRYGYGLCMPAKS